MIRFPAAAFALAASILVAVPAAAAPPQIAGIAFVDNSVTAMGSGAHLPPGTPVIPPGSTVTGTSGCPTDRYNTTGLIVAVITYDGRPTAASLTITEHTARGTFQRAPYYIDLNPGVTLQFLGPIFDNGQYDLDLVSSFTGPMADKTHASFTLDRECRQVR